MKKKAYLTEVIIRWLIVLVCAAIVIFPIYWLFNVVFSPPGMAVAITPRLYPTSFSAGIEKIQQVLTKGPFLNSLGVSFLYASFQVIGILVVTSLAAYEFSLCKFPGKNVLFIIALSGMMVPLAVMAIPLYRVIVALKWMNTLQALAVPGMASALSLFIIKQYMENIPVELIEAAKIDGASNFKTFLFIVLPQSINALLTVGIINFVFAWGNFLWPLLVSNKPGSYTASVLVAMLSATTAYTPIDQLVAAYLLVTIPPVLVFIFLQRYIVESVTISGIKG